FSILCVLFVQYRSSPPSPVSAAGTNPSGLIPMSRQPSAFPANDSAATTDTTTAPERSSDLRLNVRFASPLISSGPPAGQPPSLPFRSPLCDDGEPGQTDLRSAYRRS